MQLNGDVLQVLICSLWWSSLLDLLGKASFATTVMAREMTSDRKVRGQSEIEVPLPANKAVVSINVS